MTGNKRMMVEETVKETRADELSAMYNMLMDKKKREKGNRYVTVFSNPCD